MLRRSTVFQKNDKIRRKILKNYPEVKINKNQEKKLIGTLPINLINVTAV
jgi:hypothetical protein